MYIYITAVSRLRLSEFARRLRTGIIGQGTVAVQSLEIDESGGTVERADSSEPPVAAPEVAPPEHSGERTGVPLYRDGLLIATVVTVFVVDQVSKLVVKNSLRPYQSWPREGFFRITHGTNSGTAFGLFPDQTIFLIFASFFAIGFLFYFYRTQAIPSVFLRLAIGLQLGGAFGNLLDRVRSGEVVDFIDVSWWPIFNLADSSIMVGIALLATAVLFGRDTIESAETPDESDEPDGPD